ncbi:MAG: FIST C-terminal domain-containing protein, partial [Polyangiaceae bacterium]
DRAIEAAQRLVTKRGRPALMLQLDCAGRGRLLFDEQTTARIVEPVQQAVGKDVPWLGLHTYGEIAPVGTETLFHNYTGVLCALYPRT